MTQQIKNHKPWFKKWWGIILIILISLMALGMILPDPPEEATKPDQQKNTSNLFDPAQHYELLNIADASMLGYSRRAVDILVPLGLTERQLSQVMFHVANKIKREEKADRVWVHAYHEKDEDFGTVSAAILDIDDKGNGSGEIQFISNYFLDPEKYVVTKMPENKRREFYIKKIMIERKYAASNNIEKEDQERANLRTEYKISKDEDLNIMREANIRGWKGPNIEKYAKYGYCIPKEEVGKEWYQCGTLHESSSVEWRAASHQNRVATCADIIFALYKDNRINIVLPPISDTPAVVSAIKPFAEKLSVAIDVTFLKSSQKLNVYKTAIMIMSEAGWIK